ncbi:hypothetical protein HY623_04595 [Candidatus Uhrbacteria bacterium]|nr:hypothetical protein [Candidatus Uhrbacteria bacterium]
MGKKKKQTSEPNPKAGKGTASTQKHLQVAEIKNDTIVMKDGTLRAALLVSSVNFFLKSEDEQNATIQTYQQFLNSIDYPLQIVIQSRKYDISHYLAHLQELEAQQTNDLLKMQMADYRQFVGELVQLGDIMDKKFYVVIPYDPTTDTRRGFFRQLTNVFTAVGEITLRREAFLKRKHILDQRVDAVISGLLSMSLNAARLDTQSLIELLYTTYNPLTAANQRMAEVGKLQVENEENVTRNP